ncbi:hypothetical protein OIU34_29445 [Pararhizobium sp. BT-229]|uniref:hypothetical protein n=1 Tax=Pararhizobium sp. BT-229 TaxID=2986923 RepID=UPI0021F7D5AF|nr:hypothetical protein [Pararhizobium sp. BT-229]MCV9965999.1 hypothetical protein [Pararhizobium sp. BT-229]
MTDFRKCRYLCGMYLRFVHLKVVEGMRARAGVFSAAYELKNAFDVDSHAQSRLEDLLGWFGQNLAVPSRFNLSNSKGYDRKAVTYGLSWYKPEARDHLKKSFELAALLEQNGYSIAVIKTSRPGYVLYEDEYQIVAEPFADSGLL